MKMVYNIREYNTIFTGNKGSEENAIVAIIMKLLNDNKFDNIDDVLKYNGKDFDTFMKNNRRDNIPSHYGRNIKNADFDQIVEQLKKMVNDKLSFDKEKINEVNFDNKEFVEYNGKVVDNTLSERSIEDELKYMQVENPEYQSLDQKQNTDKMMNEVVSEKKREIEFTSLDNIDRNKLNKDEQQLFDAALVDEYVNNNDKEISIEDGLTKDEENNISQLSEKNGSINISDNKETIKTSINPLSEIDVDTLTSNERDYYNAAYRYQELTGELIRLDLDNMVIITPYNEIKEIITNDGELVVDDPRLLFSENTMTTEEEKEEEQEQLEQEKVKKLEFPSPFSNYNYQENAA